MGFLDTLISANNARSSDRNAVIANRNAAVADEWAAVASQNEERVAAQVSIKNAALLELKRLDPNNALLRSETREKIALSGVAYFRKTGQVPKLPREIE